MKRFLVAALLSLASLTAAFAGSTIDPTQPTQNSALNSSVVRNNFAAAFNDINSILSGFYGATAPTNPAMFQRWVDTSAVPFVERYWDGTQWIAGPRFDTTGHTYALLPNMFNGGSGADATTFLRGDGLWVKPASGSGAADYAPQSYTCFGDSITAGSAASTNALAYCPLVGSALNLTPVNKGVSAREAVDNAADIYSVTPNDTGSQLYTYQIGMNEASFYYAGGDPIRMMNWHIIHQAQLAWLALPAKSKCMGQDASCFGQSNPITYTGSWSNDTSGYRSGTMSKVSSTNGSTATFTAYGNTIYLAYGIEDGNGGTFTVTVDGVPYATTYSQYGVTAVKTTYAAAGMTVPGYGGTSIIVTFLGQTHASGLLRMTGLSQGPHTVVLTVTSATGASNKVWFDWYGQPAGSLFATGPAVIAGAVTRTGGPAASIDVAAQAYTVATREDVQTLVQDGLNVGYADTAGYINPNTDISGDGIHPNDVGHGHIRDAYLAAIRSAQNQRSKSSGFAPTAIARPWETNASTFTGALSCTNGHSFGSGNTVNGRYQMIGVKYMYFTLDATIANQGSCANGDTANIINFPASVKANWAGHAYQLSVNGLAGTFFMPAGANYGSVALYNGPGTFPLTSGSTWTISGVVEVQ